MKGMTTFSWYSFFIIIAILIFVWILSTRTRIGRKIITQETPWSIPQWSRLLLVLGITLFILVDPLFHLLTFGIFAILYYVFVNKNFLNTNIRNIGVSNEVIGGSLPFILSDEKKLELICIPQDSQNLIAQRKAIDKCLFSFPFIDNKAYPVVKYLDGQYHLSLNLSSEKFTASLVEYIKKAGFQVNLKN